MKGRHARRLASDTLASAATTAAFAIIAAVLFGWI